MGKRHHSMKREMGEKQFVLEFLDVYRELPALWDTSCKAYNDKDIKNAQYDQLLEKYQERYPTATRSDVSKKINILRTNYRKEVKRLKEAAARGEPFASNLYYYDAISFIGYSERSRPSLDMTALSDTEETTLNYTVADTSDSDPQRKKFKPNPEDQLIQLVLDRLSQPPDDDKKLCDGWAVLFKRLSEDQQVYAQKFIADILFEGQMGTLHRNSMEWNIIIEKDDSATEFEHMGM